MIVQSAYVMASNISFLQADYQHLSLKHEQEVGQLQEQIDVLQQKLKVASSSSVTDHRVQELEELNTGMST